MTVKGYRLKSHRSAKKFLASLPRDIREGILDAIDKLGAGPPAARSRWIAPPSWRIRVGNYRVLFHIHGEELRVLDIGLRDDAYGKQVDG